MGSKNSIAKKIIDLLPSADNFYDLFCGGCAITHCALLSDKYNHVYANDIEPGLPQFFLDCVNGKYSNNYRWISREDFYKLKDTDLFVRYIWSFGNNERDYLYAKDIEGFKKALHYVKCFNDFSLFEKMGMSVGLGKKNENIYRLQSLEYFKRVKSLETLKNTERLKISNNDYRYVPIKDNSVIYCDIPYKKTKKYVSGDFNHSEFFDWADMQQCPVYISSYHVDDNRFSCVLETPKMSTFGKNQVVTERVYTQNRFKDKCNKQLMLL